MIDRHFDGLRGYTVAAYNLMAVALSHATTIAWLQIISLAIGIIAGLVTLAEKWRHWTRNKNKLPTIALSLALLTSGCAAPKISHHALKGTQSIQATAVQIEKAKIASLHTTQEVTTAKKAILDLKHSATQAQLIEVSAIETALHNIEQQTEALRLSLQEAGPRLATTQASINSLGAQLLKARRDAQGYRRLKLWLALFVSAGSAYTALRMVPAASGPLRFYVTGGVAVITGITIYRML